MNIRAAGLLIRQMRLSNNWSQEGLCRGICAVSYLSKIEQGKADASDEILCALLQRLGLDWSDEPAHGALIERCYDAAFSGDPTLLREAEAELSALQQSLLSGPYFLDAKLLLAWFDWTGANEEPQALDAFETVFTPRQHALWLLTQNRPDEAVQRLPCPLTWYYAGLAAYNTGAYPAALEHLQRGYDAAAESGFAWRMLDSKFLIVNCYSNLLDFDRVRVHARTAKNLARALGDTGALEALEYNQAATALELGHVQEAYDSFLRIQEPDALTLHKMAICCEKLGKPEHARRALDLAQHMPCSIDETILSSMCAVVRYRLDHPDYLREPNYGELLLGCFALIRRELPAGFASFHLPWVLEWYTAARQYRRAYELLQDFPAYTHL